VESNDLLDLLLCCLVRLVLSRQVGLVHRFAATPAVSQLNWAVSTATSRPELVC